MGRRERPRRPSTINDEFNKIAERIQNKEWRIPAEELHRRVIAELKAEKISGCPKKHHETKSSRAKSTGRTLMEEC
ncbi:hypothetical protein PENTCL1PPCAC_5728, partial [Pristionchus entomophagus]